MTPEDMVQAPIPTWRDYLEMEILEDGPPPPEDEFLLADQNKAPLAIKAPVERHILTDQNKGEKNNESTTTVTLYNPKNDPKAVDPPDDIYKTIKTFLNNLANKIDSSILDNYVQQDETSDVSADMSTKLSNLTLSNNSNNSLIDVEFSALLNYSTSLMMSIGNDQTKKCTIETRQCTTLNLSSTT